jgi:hypothetical protein
MPRFIPQNIEKITIREARRQFGRAATDYAAHEPINVKLRNSGPNARFAWLCYGASGKYVGYYLLPDADVSVFRDDYTLRPYTFERKIIDEKNSHAVLV